MLEFAIVLPVLVALCVGCVELGRALFTYSAVETAMRGGARFLAQVPDPICRPDCSWGPARAIEMTTDQIQINTGIARELVRIWSLDDPPPGTVVLRAQVTVNLRLLTGVGNIGLWTIDISRQEQRVAG